MAERRGGRPRRALDERDFRLLFLGQSASAIGDRAVVVALALYITKVTGSATDLGIVLAAQSAPFVALLLFGGVWADRLPRQRLMLAADLVRGMLHVLLAILILAGSAPIAAIAAIEFGFGAAQAFFQPAYTGLLPQTVPDELVQEARGLTELMMNVSFVLGPALATVLVLSVGAGTTVAIDAATFFTSAWFLMRISPRPRGEDHPAPGARVIDDLRAGFREVRSRSWVWVTILAFAGIVFCAFAPWYALAPGVARSVYGSVGTFGWLETAFGVGAVLGGIVAIRWAPARPLFLGLLLSTGYPLENGLLALGAPVAVTVAGGVAGGIGFAMLIVWWETALVRHIPPSALSRVSSFDWMGALGLNPVGYAVAGPLAGALGARTVLGAGSAIGIVLMLLAALPRATRRLGQAPADLRPVAARAR